MPKLKTNNPVKELFGYQIDKENEEVAYNDLKHIYFNKLTGEPYISVTTLIHSYEPEFNELFFARYKALEELTDYDRFSLIRQQLLNTQIFKYDLLEKLKVNRDEFETKVQEIINNWHNTRDEACEHGTFVHSLYEEMFYGKTHFDLSNYDSPDVCGEFKCVKGYYPKKLEEGMYPEYLVSWVSPEGLHISGQVDLLCLKGNELRIYDYKTNKQIKKRGYFNSAKKKNVCMKYPLNDLESCNYNTYQMQLSTYAYMVQQLNPEVEVKELKLIHIDREGKQTIYPCKYLKEEVERMIKHYAKSLKTNELLDRNKPVIC